MRLVSYTPRSRSLMEEMLRMPDLWEDRGQSDLRGVAADVYETPESVVVEMVLPGIKPEDVQINVTGDILTISGESKEESHQEKRDYYQKEVRYGNFAQSVSLPSSVRSEKAEATFKHGMLKVLLPKSEEAKPRQIQIKSQE